MKIILLGSNGMLGTYLRSYFTDKYELLSLTRKDIDLSTCESDIISYLDKITNAGDIIINSAGVIKQRDYNIKDMIMVNGVLPHILNKLKVLKKCEVIHITTDCVFSGKEESGYTENSLHDCLDDYGKSKSIGENENNTNIRTSIIGEERYNKKSLIEWIKSNKNKTINGYSNHLWNGVTCLELSKLIHKIISENLFWTGTKHIHSPNTVSKYELTSMINEIYELNIHIDKIETKDNCFRNLSSLYDFPIIKDLYTQIKEQKEFKING
jgi:dTDP-4-dehydrorhamnose reductase